MSDTILVYQYTRNAGGWYGYRISTRCINENELKKIEEDPDRQILEKDITSERARALTAGIPEICHLLAAIEKAFKESSDPSNTTIEAHLRRADFAIRINRDYRAVYKTPYGGHTPDLKEHLDKLSVESSLKGPHFAGLILKCPDLNTGRVAI
jgi:hypothetical protein